MIKLTCCRPRVFDNPVCGLTRVGCVEVQIAKDRIGQVGVEVLLDKSPALF